MTDTFDFPCTVGTAGDTKLRIKRARFGDGYQQVAKDGLNARVSQWTIQTPPMPEDDAAEVTDFLDRNTGRPFYWTPPGRSEPSRFFCAGYTEAPALGRLTSITATFEFFA